MLFFKSIAGTGFQQFTFVTALGKNSLDETFELFGLGGPNVLNCFCLIGVIDTLNSETDDKPAN